MALAVQSPRERTFEGGRNASSVQERPRDNWDSSRPDDISSEASRSSIIPKTVVVKDWDLGPCGKIAKTTVTVAALVVAGAFCAGLAVAAGVTLYHEALIVAKVASFVWPQITHVFGGVFSSIADAFSFSPIFGTMFAVFAISLYALSAIVAAIPAAATVFVGLGVLAVPLVGIGLTAWGGAVLFNRVLPDFDQRLASLGRLILCRGETSTTS